MNHNTIAVQAIMHPALASLWPAATPAFVWSYTCNTPVWANRSGLPLWAEDIAPALLGTLSSSIPFALRNQLQHFSRSLSLSESSLGRFRFFLHGQDITFIFTCSRIAIAGESCLLAQSLHPLPRYINPLSSRASNDSYSAATDACLLLRGIEQEAVLALSHSGEILSMSPKASSLLETEIHKPFIPFLRSRCTTNPPFPIDTRTPFPHSDQHPSPVTLDYQRQVLFPCQDGLPLFLFRLFPRQHDTHNPGVHETLPDIPPQQGGTSTQPLFGIRRNMVTSPPIANDKGNVFPFTGIPSRIHPDRNVHAAMGPRDRDAFREIARVLGARMEGREFPEENDPFLDDPVSSPHELPDHSDMLTYVLDKVSDAILIYDAETAFYANPRFLHMIGYDTLPDCLHDVSLPEILSRVILRDDLDTPVPQGEVPPRATAPDRTIKLQTIEWKGRSAILLLIKRDFDPSVSTQHKTRSANTLHSGPNVPDTLLHTAQHNPSSPDEACLLDIATDGILIVSRDHVIVNASPGAMKILPGLFRAGMALEHCFSKSAYESIRQCLDDMDAHTQTSNPKSENDLHDPHPQLTVPLDEQGSDFLNLRFGRPDQLNSHHFCILISKNSGMSRRIGALVCAQRTAENANAKKSALLNRISHEIRTPLNAIIGFSEMMDEECLRKGDNTSRFREYIRNIRHGSQHILSLTNDLIEISRIEEGKLKLDMVEVDINEIASCSITMLQPEAMRRRTIIRQNLSASLPKIIADRGSLYQAVFNLLSNAVKFNKPGGQVLVSTQLTDNHEIRLHIRDTGIGMTAGQIEIALESSPGTIETSPSRQDDTFCGGFGIPLAKALLEAHEAKFSLSSTPDRGTLVEVLFPQDRSVSRTVTR